MSVYAYLRVSTWEERHGIKKGENMTRKQKERLEDIAFLSIVPVACMLMALVEAIL